MCHAANRRRVNTAANRWHVNTAANRWRVITAANMFPLISLESQKLCDSTALVIQTSADFH